MATYRAHPEWYFTAAGEIYGATTVQVVPSKNIIFAADLVNAPGPFPLDHMPPLPELRLAGSALVALLLPGLIWFAAQRLFRRRNRHRYQQILPLTLGIIVAIGGSSLLYGGWRKPQPAAPLAPTPPPERELVVAAAGSDIPAGTILTTDTIPLELLTIPASAYDIQPWRYFTNTASLAGAITRRPLKRFEIIRLEDLTRDGGMLRPPAPDLSTLPYYGIIVILATTGVALATLIPATAGLITILRWFRKQPVPPILSS